MKRIKRIGPMSVGKILGLLYVIFGGIFGLISGIILILVSIVAPTDSPEKVATMGIGLGIIISIPIFYGVIGLVSGIFFTYIYNLLASWVGGIEIELK